ncbi:hypothetical protein BS47DRAFT_181170 [Hydnum rufescens UP504]|uniref:Xylanolytic transcriptional activator regulatory domain-containing protein n=1 Tax=Hydnum rufescens UP504 TaxID=1448309 RepID=A0A9P6ANE2_9AGAM|nr:hypothetical protein BS47DRAFT_181170 [Hydnum rufescens UP504]
MTVSLGKLVIDSSVTAYYSEPAPLSSPQEKYALIKAASPPNVVPYDRNIRYKLCRSINDVAALDPQSAPTWLSFLPGDTASILSRLEHDVVLDRYFRYYCSWSYPVIPDLFLRDFALATSPNNSSKAPPLLRHYSVLFHNAILSVALAYSDNVHLRSREIRDRFANHAKSFFEAECRAPMLSTVQGLAILSSYHSGLSEQALGFMYFGVSIRMGQALDLDVGVRGVDMSNQDVVERNWVFWSLYCQVVFNSPYRATVCLTKFSPLFRINVGASSLAATRGSGFIISISQSLRSTRSFRGITVMPDTDTPEGKTDATSASQPSSTAESFLWQVKLMKISSSILDVVYGMAGVIRRGIDLVQADQLHLDLLSWERALPKDLYIPLKTVSTCSSPPGVFMLNMVFHWLLILLLSPFFKPHIKIWPPASSSTETSSDGTPARRRYVFLSKLRTAALNECPSSATYIVSLFGAYRRLHTLRLSNLTAIQVVYTAGKTHLVTILAGGPNPSSRGNESPRGIRRMCANNEGDGGDVGFCSCHGRYTTGIVTAEPRADAAGCDPHSPS